MQSWNKRRGSSVYPLVSPGLQPPRTHHDYLYAPDTKAGDRTGDNFKNDWHVIKP
nr:hypothetical protein [Rhodoferax sp.]